MPELPEVEAARVLVHNYCTGKRIEQATAADDTKVIEGVTPEELQNALQGRTIVDAHRKGKHLWLELDGDSPAVLFHLGMTGYMVVEGVPIVQYVNAKKRGEEWPPKYWKVVIETDCGVKLAFCDPRRFGRIRLQADPENNEPISKLGFDPILSMPDLDTFSAMLRKQKRAVKPLLLDQSFSAGVGNWVADEILYQARIHPEQKAACLDEAQCSALHHQMQAVLQTAVEAGADSEKFPKTWLFHQKWGNGKKGPAPRLDGNKIEYKQVGGRTTAFVPALQKLTAQPAEKPKPAKKAAENGDTAGAAAPKQARKRVVAKAPKAQAAAEEEEPEEEPKEEPEEELEEDVKPKKKGKKSKAANGRDGGKKAAPAKTRGRKS